MLRLWVSARACLGPRSDLSTYFQIPELTARSPDVLAVAPCAVPDLAVTLSLPAHGPNLVGGTITLNDPTKVTVLRGTTVSMTFGCVALSGAGLPQTFTRQCVLDQTLLAGAVTINCEQDPALRIWGIRRVCSPANFDERTLERTFLLGRSANEPPRHMGLRCSPRSAVLLGRDSWGRFNTRFYRYLPRPFDQSITGELTLSHHAPTDAIELDWVCNMGEGEVGSDGLQKA